MKSIPASKENSPEKDKGPAPWLFYVMLALIVAALVVTIMLSPMHGSSGSTSHSSQPATSSH